MMRSHQLSDEGIRASNRAGAFLCVSCRSYRCVGRDRPAKIRKRLVHSAGSDRSSRHRLRSLHNDLSSWRMPAGPDRVLGPEALVRSDSGSPDSRIDRGQITCW